ncbi:MAG: hypothetical protein U9M89_03395 [Patescibacteria group bacterium]|nr:hypothetical protein [Patescibacteria group bacterium]
MAKKKSKVSTQKYLPFKEIREGVISMKNGSMLVVLMVNAINFNLKAPDEQTALLNGYKRFLNSLEFPIQILIQSRVLDLDDYLGQLEKLAINQQNELLRMHTNEYAEFIRELIGVSNIMNKTFYVVISNKYIGGAKDSILARLFKRKPITSGGRWKENRDELMSNASLVASGLNSLGLHSVLLNTKELIDLVYSTYNPDTARKQKLLNVSFVDANIIQKALDKNKQTK